MSPYRRFPDVKKVFQLIKCDQDIVTLKSENEKWSEKGEEDEQSEECSRPHQTETACILIKQ